jgi:hypothetical protein
MKVGFGTVIIEECKSGSSQLGFKSSAESCLLSVTYFPCHLYLSGVMKEVSQNRKRSEWSGRMRQLGHKYAVRLNTERALRTETNGVASRTCLQTYIIWNLDRSCTFPQRIRWSYTLLPASLTAKRCAGLRKGFTRPSSIYHNGLRLYFNIRVLKVVANTWGAVNFVAIMVSLVQNTPFSTKYHVHWLQCGCQWYGYLSPENYCVIKILFGQNEVWYMRQAMFVCART